MSRRSEPIQPAGTSDFGMTGRLNTTEARNRRSDRSGVILSMELVLVLPIFLILILSIVEFSMLMTARARITDAARMGSRLLCVSGLTPDEIRDRIGSMLGPQMASQCQIEIQSASTAGAIGNVRIRVPMSCASPDLLWMTGFSIRGRSIDADAPMVMERVTASEQIIRL